MTITEQEIDVLKARHAELAAAFIDGDESGLEDMAVIECALMAAGAISYGEEPFADAEGADS